MSVLTSFARFFLKNREKSISEFKANAKKDQNQILSTVEGDAFCLLLQHHPSLLVHRTWKKKKEREREREVEEVREVERERAKERVRGRWRKRRVRRKG